MRVLVTGAAGFVGRAVVRRLLARADPPKVRAVVHSVELPPALGETVEVVRADLAVPGTLRGLCRDVDVVLHLAVRISDDAGECERVNGLGTETLVGEAKASAVKRFVSLSNCAVYGWTIHRGADEEGVVVRPATPVSRSRVRAERAVLSGGGTVLRPLFVYGDGGDTRFIPAILRASQKLPFIVAGGRARLSVIAVDELANVLEALSNAPPRTDLGGAFHVNDGHPVTFLEILRALESVFGMKRPRWSLPYGVARWVMRAAGGSTGGLSASAAHRLFLVSHDHWYAADKLRARLGLPREASLPDRLATYREWYEGFSRGGPEREHRE